MLYERGKLLSALISGASLFVGVLAVASDAFASIRVFTTPVIIAAGLAAIGAAIAIASARGLAREREKRKVFIVYAREDLETAKRLARRLGNEGFNPWLDVNELNPGQEWKKEIRQAIENSAAAVVILSKHLSKRGYVQAELREALRLLQSDTAVWPAVLPVRIDDSELPENLRGLHWVDLRDESGFVILRNALQQILRFRTA